MTALDMLETYNKRLSEEMEARKSVARMIHDYIAYQKDLLSQAEETLEVNQFLFLNILFIFPYKHNKHITIFLGVTKVHIYTLLSMPK